MQRIELARAETIEEARVKADNYRQAHTNVQIRRTKPSGFKIVWRRLENVQEGKKKLAERRAKEAESV